MKTLALLAALIITAASAFAANRPWTSSEVIESAKRKGKVVIQGKIERAINFDYFIVTDESGALLLNASGVRQRLGVGDTVVVWGRYLGRSDRYPQARAEIEAIELAAADTPEAAKILEGRTTPAPEKPIPAEDTAASPAPSALPNAPATVESRLRTLDDLREKKLVTEDEYKEQRKRILSEL